MTRLLVVAILCGSVLFGGACYGGYSGIYFLNRSHEVPKSQMENLSRDLREVLHRFGFRDLPGFPQSQLAFVLERRSAAPGIRNLDGSEGVVTVVVDLESQRIIIRDRSHTWETPFCETLKAYVRRVFADAGLEEVEFERQMDLFF